MKVFYMGASDSTLNKIKEKIIIKFPNVQVDTIAHLLNQFFKKG